MTLLRKIALKLSFAATNPCTLPVHSLRNFSSLNPEYIKELPTKAAYTSLKYPREHTSKQIGMWYSLDPDTANRLFHFDGLTNRYKALAEIFCETSLMIREPALDIINYINKSNLEYPANKFLLYGRHGVGKTLSLAHTVHHFAEEGWVLVHAAVPARWATIYKEIVPSSTQPGFYDHTLDASLWLQKFRQQNGPLLENPDLVTSETYQWTQREVTEKGSPLLSLVDYGISRARYASDCVFHLTSELKKLAQGRRIKLAVVIDGVNSLFSPMSKYLREDRSIVPCEKFTLYQAFLQLLKKDWNNGVIVCSTDIKMSTLERRKSYLPRYLLGRKGWETLDPFVPIQVDAYSEREFESAVNYMITKRWLQHPAGATREGKDELAFLSARNPSELVRIVNSH